MSIFVNKFASKNIVLFVGFFVIRGVAKKSTTKSSEKFNPEKSLANDRREKFCQLIVDGKKASL